MNEIKMPKSSNHQRHPSTSQVNQVPSEQPYNDEELLISAREFLPTSQANASRSCLKPRAMQNDESEELNGILALVSQKGELILKAKNIVLIPKAFYYHRFEQIQYMDIWNNDITEIEGAIC